MQGRMQGEAWGARAPPRAWLYEKNIDPIPLQLLNFYSRWTVDQQLELSSFKKLP